jgi:excisionase family DNA binding protein
MDTPEQPAASVLAVSVEEAARLLGVSPRTIQNLIFNRQLLSRKIGKRTVIPMTALQNFLRKDHPTRK